MDISTPHGSDRNGSGAEHGTANDVLSPSGGEGEVGQRSADPRRLIGEIRWMLGQTTDVPPPRGNER